MEGDDHLFIGPMLGSRTIDDRQMVFPGKRLSRTSHYSGQGKQGEGVL